MRNSQSKPEAESHHRVRILDRDIDINFRYFSPSKSPSSVSIASEEKMPTIPLSDSSGMFNDIAAIYPKKALDPRQASDKFYIHQFQDAHSSIMSAYEKFQSRLLQPHIKPSRAQPKVQRITRINLSQTRREGSRKKLKNHHPLKQIKNDKHKNQPRPYIKRAHINLYSKNNIQRPEQTQHNLQNSLAEKQKLSNIHRFKIKLFEGGDNKGTDSGAAYKTPRTPSKSKKGIRVFSSASTKKHSDSYQTSKQHQKHATLSANQSKSLLQGSKNISLTRSVSRFNESVGNSLIKKKKRISSRQKLQMSSKPKIFLYQENQ